MGQIHIFQSHILLKEQSSSVTARRFLSTLTTFFRTTLAEIAFHPHISSPSSLLTSNKHHSTIRGTSEKRPGSIRSHINRFSTIAILFLHTGSQLCITAFLLAPREGKSLRNKGWIDKGINRYDWTIVLSFVEVVVAIGKVFFKIVESIYELWLLKLE